jgi:hypothetical protein
VTVPGGVPNLPALALTLDNIASRLQDMTPPAIRNLANQGLPAIFDGSNGGNVLSDFTPFGVITRLFAEFAAAVAKADPNDIQGPEDLPGLMLDFIEGLPIIGELVGLLEAIGGTYDGDDAVLLAVQEIFYPIRKLLQLVSGQPVGFPTVEEVTVGWTDLGDALIERAEEFQALLVATGQATAAQLGAFINQIQQIIDAVYQALNGGVSIGNTVAAVKAALQAIPGANILIAGTDALPGYLANIASTGLYDATAGFSNLATSLLKNLTPTGGNIGQFDAGALAGALNPAVTFLVGASNVALSTLLGNINATGQLLMSGATGAMNTAVTIGGQAVSSLFNGSGQFIGVLNSAATGALNSALTVGAVPLSTLFTNINSSGQLLLSGATGAINTAVTIGGQAVSTIFNGSGQFIGVLNAAATGAINTAVTVAGTAIGTINTNASTAVTNAAGLITGINNAVAGVTSGASSLLVDAQTNLGLLLGSAPLYLQGLSGTFGQTATNQAYAAAAAAAAAQSAALTAQQSAFNAVFNVSPSTAGNVNLTTDFTSMSNASTMSGVMSPGSTNMGITSGTAVRQVTTAGTDAEVFPTQTTSDYQVVTATVGGLNSYSTNFTTGIIARVNSARTTFVIAWLDTAGASAGQYLIKLGCQVSGSYTGFSASVSTAVATGGVLKLIVGDPSSSSPYAMQVLYNGTPVITYTDSSHVSQLGASNRYVGLYMNAATSGGTPPAIRTVSYQDNPPAPASYPFSGEPTAGTKGRRYASGDCGREDRDNGTAWENVWIGPLTKATAPPTSGWSWVNQGTASVAADADALLITAPTSTRNWRLRARTLSPSSNYTAAAYISVAGVPPTGTNRWYTGIGLRNSTSGSFITFGPSLYAASSIGAQLTIYRWTNATTFSASSFEIAASALHGGSLINQLRIKDDGTNRYFDYTPDGVDWINVFSEGRTAFITPDQFIFGADNEASGQDCKIRLRSLVGIS